ncbi:MULTISPECIES: hypothetical protein [unclassified Hahella]|uniref:hypothetical protein n=1 Tax=unclassified Hahella TaxID=2624107 RepID=UPI001C1F0798|nr:MULTISPECIES: hypothetical protein [unclassified Hahella]MBU6953377.1 hypothetical protein [Hahella sp. HN01]MDG9669340.1 hypothetical protein [Hahella sp. CR1]
MSRSLSVKGWLECTEEDVVLIRDLVERLPDLEDIPIEPTKVEKYSFGWVLNPRPKGWMCYAFYGYDIRSRDVDYVYWKLEKITALIPELNGYFQIDDFDAEFSIKKITIANSEISITEEEI